MKPLRAIDVCAVAGGWACAARGLPIKIEAAFDLRADALKTYSLNHPHVQTTICDVVHHDFRDWRGVDLILGGIPCEQLSPARRMNKRASVEELSVLDALVARFLALPGELSSRWFCYEDVVQLERRLPILTPYFIVESSSHSPQRRKRMFVGNIPTPARGTNKDLLRDTLRKGPFRVGPRLHGRTPKVANSFTRENFYPWRHDKKSPTVTDLCSRRDAEAATPHGDHWRQLEWQELASLQGFPEDYLFYGSPGRVSKMIAQAVEIRTARAILEALVSSLE